MLMEPYGDEITSSHNMWIDALHTITRVQVTGGVSRTRAASSTAVSAEQQQQPAARGADGGLLSQALGFLHHMMRGGGGGGGAVSAGQQPQAPSPVPAAELAPIEAAAAAAAPQLSSGPQGFAACAIQAPAWGGRWRSRAVPSLREAVRAAAEGAHEEGELGQGELQEGELQEGELQEGELAEAAAEGESAGSGAAVEVEEQVEQMEQLEQMEQMEQMVGAGRGGSKEKLVQLDSGEDCSAHDGLEAMHEPGVAAGRAVDNKALVLKARQAAEQLRQRVRAAAIDRRGDTVQAVKVRRGGRAVL
jgi:hypothetical protein